MGYVGYPTFEGSSYVVVLAWMLFLNMVEISSCSRVHAITPGTLGFVGIHEERDSGIRLCVECFMFPLCVGSSNSDSGLRLFVCGIFRGSGV